MDAVSFVLGVRSTHLRSNQLKDLIHRKTTQSSPDDPTTAHVEALIRVAGKDYRFKRSILDNGSSSSYRVDGKVVSWQKYNEKLQSLNILVKARNFLVFQGDVESIASQNSKDLTRLFEEVSGSAEYREEYERLKDEQEKATTNSIFNLNKKKGLSAEIRQYEEQKSEAEKYERLLSRKNELIQSHILWKLFHIEQKVNDAGQQMVEKTRLREQLQSDYSVVEGNWKQFKAEQATIQKELLKLDKLGVQKRAEIDKKRPEILKLNEQISHSEKKIVKFDKAIEKLNKEISEQQSTLDELKKQLATLEKASKKFESALSSNCTSNISLNEVQLLEYQKLRKQVDSEVGDVNQRLEDLKRSIKTQEIFSSKLKCSLDEWQVKVDNLKADLKHGVERKEAIIAFLETVDSEKDTLQKDLQKAITDRKRLDQTEVEVEEKLSQIYHELSEAKYDRKESERQAKFKESVDCMMRLFTGVHGRLIDLCEVKSQKYEYATSLILGKNMDSIVVEDDRTARECIEFLKEQQSCLATFLPLNTIQTKPVSERLRLLGQGSRLAIDVLTFDPAFTKVFEYACRNAIICDTLEIAKDICYQKKHNVKAVTLDGTVIHKSGLITGGMTLQDSLKPGKWEERKMELLQKSKKALEGQLHEITREKQDLGNIEEIRSNLNSATSRAVSAREDLSALQKKIDGIRQEYQFSSDELAKVQGEYEKDEKALRQLQKEKTTLDKGLKEVEDRVFSSFCKSLKIQSIREYEGDRLRAIEELSEKRVAFNNQISRLQSEISFVEEQLQSSTGRMNSSNETLQAEHEALAKLTDALKKLKDTGSKQDDDLKLIASQIDKIKRDEEEKTSEANILRKTLQSCQREMDHIGKEVTAMELQVEKLHSERVSLLRKCKLEGIDLPCNDGSLDSVIRDNSETESDENSMDVDGEESSERLSDVQISKSIHINYDSLDAKYKDNGRDIAETHFLDEIEKILSELERMTPNMKAVERLDGASARLQVTNEEFEKTRQLAKTTKEKFNLIKKKRLDAFKKAFGKVSERIDKIYKELTKSRQSPLGGTAYLTLENPEEPYLDGIKYHAMPPMKRFRDMDLLSGGEKTMAALALLLAIHEYQPAPFFVLDEVDAALDNANVSKLAEYLVTHSARDQLQFIVISLKSSLYEKAESLVGVYRDVEEKSSRLLTLDLGQYEE